MYTIYEIDHVSEYDIIVNGSIHISFTYHALRRLEERGWEVSEIINIILNIKQNKWRYYRIIAEYYKSDARSIKLPLIKIITVLPKATSAGESRVPSFKESVSV